LPKNGYFFYFFHKIDSFFANIATTNLQIDRLTDNISSIIQKRSAMHFDPDHIVQQLAKPLPGRAAQYRMASIHRVPTLALDFEPPKDAKVAAVMLILHQPSDNQEWHTLLIQRTAHPHDRHSGQISFPGGRQEPQDADLMATALRESEEEVGMGASTLQVVGKLTDLYIPVSNFLVHPFVAISHEPIQIRTQPSEVQSVLLPAVGHFMDPENIKRKTIQMGAGMNLLDVPCYQYKDQTIWGATAMILSEFTAIFD
jgi:8-oxo-dGTP pyrophosphatase MutT (NUDIX family)